MYNLIYEAKPFYGVKPVFVIFSLVAIFVTLYLILSWGKFDTGDRIFFSIISAVMLLVVFSQVYTAIDAKHKVYNAYVSGEYLTVEGVISEYTLAEEGQPNLPDDFYVNDVSFSVPGFVSIWGYPLKQVDGGILKDGIYVRICYIPYKFENVIMKLEILE